MEDTRPYPLTPAEWKEIMADQTVRESWGIEANNTTLAEFSSQTYAAKFHFVSGSPGYVGDLFILQGDTLTGDAPMVFRRGANGELILL
jgi:hypothetical protein